MTVLDPPGEYYDRNYYAVYFTDPDGMKLEGMIWAPPEQKPQTGIEEEVSHAKIVTAAFRAAICQLAARSSNVSCATTALRPRRLAA